MAQKISPSTPTTGMMARKAALLATDRAAIDAAHDARLQSDNTERAEQLKRGQELFTSLHEKTREASTERDSNI